MPTHRRNSFVPTPQPQLPTSLPPGETYIVTSFHGTKPTSTTESSTTINLQDLINAPSRWNQPLLHPTKQNGGLWFKIDKSVGKHVQTVWQNNFMVPCRNWSKTPQEKKDIWWQDFVQHFYWAHEHHDLVYNHWKAECMDSISERINSKKRSGAEKNQIMLVRNNGEKWWRSGLPQKP